MRKLFECIRICLLEYSMQTKFNFEYFFKFSPNLIRKYLFLCFDKLWLWHKLCAPLDPFPAKVVPYNWHASICWHILFTILQVCYSNMTKLLFIHENVYFGWPIRKCTMYHGTFLLPCWNNSANNIWVLPSKILVWLCNLSIVEASLRGSRRTWLSIILFSEEGSIPSPKKILLLQIVSYAKEREKGMKSKIE